MNKLYFQNVKIGDEVFGVVFGKGVVTNVWEDGFYSFEVTYENNMTVPYTLEGVPGWGRMDFQTVFYKDDIDIMSLDIEPSENSIKSKKVIKYRMKGILEVKCPSGIWQNASKCPGYVIEQYIEDAKFHLFRKQGE